jgi:hypothetical protein
MPVGEIQEALSERGIIPDDIKPKNIRSKKLLENNNFILYFARALHSNYFSRLATRKQTGMKNFAE